MCGTYVCNKKKLTIVLFILFLFSFTSCVRKNTENSENNTNSSYDEPKIETEQLVKAKLNPPRTIIKPNRQLAEYLSDLEDNISKTMGTRVKIHHKNGKGKIEIDYYSNDEFERIMEYFKKQ